MTTNKKYSLTKEGLQTYKDELKKLIDVDRPANIKALQDAKSQGDLSENADYDAARDEQARIDSRINELNDIIKNHVIIEADENSNEISLGKFVTIEFLGLGKVETYQIVGTLEADPFNHKVSNESPLGVAISGHVLGDVVTVVTEKGKEFKVEIKDVK